MFLCSRKAIKELKSGRGGVHASFSSSSSSMLWRSLFTWRPAEEQMEPLLGKCFFFLCALTAAWFAMWERVLSGTWRRWTAPGLSLGCLCGPRLMRAGQNQQNLWSPSRHSWFWSSWWCWCVWALWQVQNPPLYFEWRAGSEIFMIYIKKDVVWFNFNIYVLSASLCTSFT